MAPKPNFKPLNMKNFWVYVVVLFSVTLVLILLASYFQNIALKNLESNYINVIENINNNKSILENIQDINNQLRNKNDSLEEENKRLLVEKSKAIDDFIASSKEKSDLKIINDSLTLYLERRYGAARRKLTLIDVEGLSDSNRQAYDSAKALII